MHRIKKEILDRSGSKRDGWREGEKERKRERKAYIGLEQGDIVLIEGGRVLLVRILFGVRSHGGHGRRRRRRWRALSRSVEGAWITLAVRRLYQPLYFRTPFTVDGCYTQSNSLSTRRCRKTYLLDHVKITLILLYNFIFLLKNLYNNNIFL